MTVTREEEIVLLYTLNACGRRPSAGRAIDYILMNNLLAERSDDDDIVSTQETRIRNRIRWIRQNLKDKGQLTMPEQGIWQVTQAGLDRLDRAARFSLDPEFNDLFTWERFSDDFQVRLKALGEDRKNKIS